MSERNETDKIKLALWQREDQLKQIQKQIDAIRPLRMTEDPIDRKVWFEQRFELTTQECICEQDIEAYKVILSRRGVRKEEYERD